MIQNFVRLGRKLTAKSFARFLKPARKRLNMAPPLVSNGEKPLKMTFEDQLNALIYFRLEGHESGRDLMALFRIVWVVGCNFTSGFHARPQHLVA